MCNLYSLTKGQAAIRELARAMVDRTGNLPPMPGIFPDYSAPIVRMADGERELTMARWGMPSSQKALLDAAGYTNVTEGAKVSPGVSVSLAAVGPDGAVLERLA